MGGRSGITGVRSASGLTGFAAVLGDLGVNGAAGGRSTGSAGAAAGAMGAFGSLIADSGLACGVAGKSLKDAPASSSKSSHLSRGGSALAGGIGCCGRCSTGAVATTFGSAVAGLSCATGRVTSWAAAGLGLKAGAASFGAPPFEPACGRLNAGALSGSGLCRTGCGSGGSADLGACASGSTIEGIEDPISADGCASSSWLLGELLGVLLGGEARLTSTSMRPFMVGGYWDTSSNSLSRGNRSMVREWP